LIEVSLLRDHLSGFDGADARQLFAAWVLFLRVVVITVTDVKGSTVQIGIEAPRDIKVYRQELADKIDSAAELTTALE